MSIWATGSLGSISRALLNSASAFSGEEASASRASAVKSGAAPEAPRRLKIEVLRSPGRSSGKSVEVEINDETHPLHPAPRLARRADPRRAARA